MKKLSVPFMFCVFIILAACSNSIEKEKQKLLSVLHSAYFSAQASHAKLGYFPDSLGDLKSETEACNCAVTYYCFGDRFFIKVEKGHMVYTISDKNVVVDKDNKRVTLSSLVSF